MTTKQSLGQTKKNLEAAFAGESETGHAHAHLALLYPAKDMTVVKVLEAAIAGERYEHTVMYPGFEKEAKAEADASAAAEFREQAAEEGGSVHQRSKVIVGFAALKLRCKILEMENSQ